MSNKEFSEEELAQLASVAALPDNEIDVSDIPEAAPENWLQARRGGRRVAGRSTLVRLDADVSAWFARQHSADDHQGEINRILRQHIAEIEKPSRE